MFSVVAIFKFIQPPAVSARHQVTADPDVRAGRAPHPQTNCAEWVFNRQYVDPGKEVTKDHPPGTRQTAAGTSAPHIWLKRDGSTQK